MNTDLHWKKSSFTGENGNCVELPSTLDGVRDSKHRKIQLSVHRTAVAALVRHVKNS
ncbi:uncharacterized protein DUF397 [Herbihabitans rhizosphaerae]|uniref:Uncharacterized protein DUF397 n=1 Tax=Herbihabitans rhizosphaerae TaxID=1872711 RepID=A0A4Q7L5L0_9PSEU|nr:DUF397 domain-containing protein [Herbihabitans rhizosphaerae]RZS44617.1 uncharacterized protein DUF397 [Herbihabitans rhizosphaerae]